MLPAVPVCCTRSNSTTPRLYASMACSSLFCAVARSRWACTTWIVGRHADAELAVLGVELLLREIARRLRRLHALGRVLHLDGGVADVARHLRSSWRSCTSI